MELEQSNPGEQNRSGTLAEYGSIALGEEEALEEEGTAETEQRRSIFEKLREKSK